MARDGALPARLAEVSAKRSTPWAAIIVIAVAASVFSLVGDVGDVADITNADVLFAFMLVNAALVRIRLRGNEMPGAFRTPFVIRRVPAVLALGAVVSLAMLIYTGATALAFLAGVLALGACVDACLRRASARRAPPGRPGPVPG